MLCDDLEGGMGAVKSKGVDTHTHTHTHTHTLTQRYIWLIHIVIQQKLTYNCKAIVCVCAQSCSTLSDPMDFSPPGSSVRGISQARILEWVAISLSVKQLYFNKNK